MTPTKISFTFYYSYKDDSGQVHRVDYIADDKGYRVVGGNGPVATTSTLDGSQAVLAATETPRKPTTVSQPAASDNRMTDEPATLMVPAVEGTTASVDATSRNASQPDQGAVDAVADVGSDKSTLPEAAPMYLLLVAGGRPAEAAESGRKPTLASPAVFYLAPLRWLMVNQKAEMKVGVPTRLAVPVSYLKNGPFGFTIPYAP